ncbi:hypothetical protein HDE_00197 [Halotydeus destructor]|nr:hypothetical protein HDE_00197 [Halotydeus destructor]
MHHAEPDIRYVEPIGLMLSAAGLGLNQRSRYVKFVNHVMSIVHPASLLILLVSAVIDLLNRFHYGYILVVVDTLVDIYSAALLRSNFQFVKESLSQSYNVLSSLQKRNMRSMGWIWFFIVTLNTCVRVVGLYFSNIEVPIHGTPAKMVVAIATECLADYVNNTIVVTYLFLCLIYGEMMIANIPRAGSSDRSTDQLEISINNLKTLAGDLDSKFSILTFIWLSQAFASSLTFSVDLSLTFRDKILGFQYVYGYGLLFSFLLIFSLCFIVGNINPRLQSEYRKHYVDILSREGLSPRIAHISSRENQYQLEFTAWSMFELSRGCILTYMSSLVTFTILFMQLNKAL